MTGPEPVRVPLPFGLCAVYVMREKPRPPEPPAVPADDPTPWLTEQEIAEQRRQTLARLTPERRAALGLSEQLELDDPQGAA